jgi:hypothetical protein
MKDVLASGVMALVPASEGMAVGLQSSDAIRAR